VSTLKKNLVVLRYGPNPCYPEVVGLRAAKDVVVDMSNGTWSCEHSRDLPDTKFSSWRRVFQLSGARGVPIGVFDKTKIAHLKNMVHATQEVFGSRLHDHDSD
jgi:hypothetical protein